MDTQNCNIETEQVTPPAEMNAETKFDNKQFPPAHPSSIQLKKIPNAVQKLSRMLRKDNFNKENLHLLRTFFCSCQFTEDGIASAAEYESVVSKANTSLSSPTLDSIIKVSYLYRRLLNT